MATGAQHYEAAELLLDQARSYQDVAVHDNDALAHRADLVSQAAVHAQLAQVALQAKWARRELGAAVFVRGEYGVGDDD